ncbi:hypothetical protein HYV12_03120 [Candidatus Dojkabacteria bacterium]|nr:hypothetical protein [Candidatus Dojkabacteria bacterium]
MNILKTFPIKRFLAILVLIDIFSVSALVPSVYANHSWGGYHWERSVNPLVLGLGDNVSTNWDTYLLTASSDWSASSVLDTTVVAGQTSPKTCKVADGRVEVCNSKYGRNGWLGIASIWINGLHITKGTVKLNDTYFNTARYNTPSWKRFVMCQEVGHIFGLDHQDENFDNTNLGSCMDYTSNPSGTAGTNGSLNNEHPNQHDYDQLVSIYSHLDSLSSISQTSRGGNGFVDFDSSNASEWGKAIRVSSDNHSSLYERDLGEGRKVLTFVIWAN